MKKHLALGLAITLTACEEKEKKQDGITTAEPASATETQQTAEVVKGSFTDTRDSKTYKTVKIGTQVWMAENLNYAENGRCYDDNADNCAKYGRLYIWYDAANVCPAGWKLPSREDWNRLVTAAGGKKTAGKKLKSKSGWENNGNGSDDFGFSALPSGFLDANPDVEGGVFEAVKYGTFWWTATKDNDGYAYRRDIDTEDEVGERNGESNSDGYSVRCIQN